MPVLDFWIAQVVNLIKHLQELEDQENKNSEICKELYPENILKIYPSGKYEIQKYKDGRIITKETGKIDFKHYGITE